MRWLRRLFCLHLGSRRLLVGFECPDCGARTDAPFGWVGKRRGA